MKNEQKQSHYRTWKSGKKWLYGAATLAVLTGGIYAVESINPITAHADVATNVTANSGKIGTANWSYSGGVLTISSGTISSAISQPWGSFTDQITKINITGPLTLSGNAPFGLFSNLPNLSSISGLTKVNTSNANNFAGMFSNDSSLSSLNLTSFDTRTTQDNRPGVELDENFYSHYWGGYNGQQDMFNNTAALSSLTLGANTLLEDSTGLAISGNYISQNTTAPTATQYGTSGAFRGTIGSVKWWLNAKGVLTIGGGTITSAIDQPWNSVKSQISSIVITGPLSLTGSAPFGFFSNLSNLNSIQNLTNINTSNANNFAGMFSNDSSLTSLNLSSFDLETTQDNRPGIELDEDFYSHYWGGYDGQQDMFQNTSALSTLIAGTSVRNYLENNDTTGLATGVRITAPKDYTAVKVKNVTVLKGSKWSNSLAFVSASNSLGSSVSLSSVKVTGSVNTAKAGKYTLTYSYGGKTAKATVTVADHTSLNVKNITVGMGTKYNIAQNFVSATNVAGTKLKVSQVKYSGSVNTAKAGNYTVTFTNGSIVKKATVTVKNLTALNVKNVTYSQFGTWNNKYAFVSAKSKSGAAVAFSSVKVTGSVNTKKTGNYTLTYSYGGLTKKVTVSIIAPQVIYDTQVQRIGWQKDPNNQATWFTNGQEAGTNGRSLRMESIKIALRLPNGMTGSIIYDAHVQRVGWQNAASPNTATATPQTISPESEWFKNGATAGTVGRALRMEAFTIKLTGNIAKYYDVKYDSHVQNYGWQYASKGLYYQAPNFETSAPVTDWFKNGQEVGTNDHALRMEALMITLVAK